MSKISEVVERFRAATDAVKSATTNLSGSEVEFVPEPGQWPVRMIAAHLADAEVAAAWRFRRVIAEENPTLEAWDQDLWAKNLDYVRRDPAKSIETFLHLRSENYALLKDLPEAAFSRHALHTERGPMTLLDLVKLNADHAESHARQLQTRRTQFKAAHA